MEIQKTADGLNTFFSDKYNETYHSRHGVLQEAQHVFLNATGITEQLKSEKKIFLLEIGFGTGFNFFLTAARALKSAAKLQYYVVENDLADYESFEKLNHHDLFSENPLYKNFIYWRKWSSKLNPGMYRIAYKNIRLNLILLNALKMKLPKNLFDVVYFDPFSPEVNPELWTTDFLRKIFSSMKKGAILTTYSAKGNVRRAMQEAGFKVEKLPGAKGKREMTAATRLV